MSPEEKLRSQRAARLAADRELLRDLTDAYGRTFQDVREELARITRQIAAARKAGVNVSPAWLYEQARLSRFERELGAHLAIYLDLAKRKIEAAQTRALIDGQTDARSLLVSTLPGGLTAAPALPVEQLERMVLGTRPGTPLGGLLAELGERAAREARETLIEGVALGLGTREIGRNLRNSFGGNAIRSLLVARTEVIRVYRDAAVKTYRQNPQVVQGWIWVAQLGPRTCPVCIARHGSFHPLDEEFASHPACRCSPAPATRSWADLGFGEFETTPRAKPQVEFDDSGVDAEIEAFVGELDAEPAVHADYVNFLKKRYHEEFAGPRAELIERISTGTYVNPIIIQPRVDRDLLESLSHPDNHNLHQFRVAVGRDKFAPDVTIWPGDEADPFELVDVLDIDDPDFFPKDNPTLAGDYASLLDAIRGTKKEGFLTLYRGMSAAEHQVWLEGAEIPVGKFFTSSKTAAMAADIPGEFPELFTFKVAKADVIETDKSVFQLVRSARLENGRIAARLEDAMREAVSETRLTLESGVDWFARQDRATQRRILGPGKLRLYEDGELRLEDVVQETVHPVWGRGLRERPLRDLAGGAIARASVTTTAAGNPLDDFRFAQANTMAEAHDASRALGIELEGFGDNVELANVVNRAIAYDISRTGEWPLPRNRKIVLTQASRNEMGHGVASKGAIEIKTPTPNDARAVDAFYRSQPVDYFAAGDRTSLGSALLHEMGHVRESSYPDALSELGEMLFEGGLDPATISRYVASVVPNKPLSRWDDFELFQVRAEAWAEIYSAARIGRLNRLPQRLQDFARRHRLI